MPGPLAIVQKLQGDLAGLRNKLFQFAESFTFYLAWTVFFCNACVYLRNLPYGD